MVHIKKVEIFGFKSFGFKNTIVQFEPGLVSIAGPNGSGKSNILDAIIFALGENRPKTMRVDKLRSLLHDIESGRRGTKMARVSVMFDNSDRKIPVDSDQVEITREMEEEGENNYYLNKKPINRSQILDLLDVANAGLNQLNAVQQGTVTRISEFSPEEKRLAIENLIGLSYFDEKKNEAIKQLDDADRRLEIALAKMGEIKKRIDELEEERNQKLRYDMLGLELNRYNAISAANKLKNLRNIKGSKEEETTSISQQLTVFDSKRKNIREEISILESEKSKFLEEVNAYNQAKSTIDNELSSAMQAYEETNSLVLTSKKRIGAIGQRTPQIGLQIQQIMDTRHSLDQQSKQAVSELDLITKERKEVESQISLLDNELDKAIEEQNRINSQRKEFDEKLRNLGEKLNSASLAFSKNESEQDEVLSKISINNKKLNEYGIQLENLFSLKTRLESLIKNHEDSVNELTQRIDSLNKRKQKILKDLEDLEIILEKSSKAAAQFETKIKTVKGIMHEDYSISKLKEESEKLGIEGLVYEMISWDKQYERAVLAVGTDWIKAVTVKDFETLVALAEFIKQKNLPRLKIIPLDAIPKFDMKMPKTKYPTLGILSDFVKCSDEYIGLKKFLFGNVVLVDSRDAAVSISKQGYKVVTLEGEYFEPKTTGYIIDINSKISKLTKIISMSTSVEGLIQSISLLKRYIQKKKSDVSKIENSINGYQERMILSDKGLSKAQNDHKDLVLKINQSSKMKEQISLRIKELEEQTSVLKTEKTKNESLIESLKERISLVQQNYSDGELERVSSVLSELNQRRASLLRKSTEIISKFNEKSQQVASLDSQGAREESKIQNLNDEKQSLLQETKDLESKIHSLESELEEKNSLLVKLREKEQELISTSGTSVGQLKEFDDKLKLLNEEDRTLTKEINVLERQNDSLSRDLKEIAITESSLQKILSGSGFDENISTFEVEPLVQALSAELRSLTYLNAKAPETYLEVASGYRSMSTRKNSLEEERNSIVKFIEEIEKDKKQTFLDAFDKVDKEIRKAFSTMTGGNAWLELQNEDDIFNSGISYLIQFPNKPKRESTSISGGEKTLAAIVFVLALQKLKPSPFYLFDEVDAHLDAPNSERLSKILEERSKESQFIMVSLKDSVVQKANLIYGVYPKNGVSHIVTYKDKRLPQMKST